MAIPANAAVREHRRKSTALDLERVNVIKALTAAEYSRRQFILNFAASKDTQLLVPGQKSDAVKAAEEWAAAWLSQNGHQAVNHEFFKYTVDARLWSTHVGNDVEFPFAFMRERFEPATDTSSQTKEKAALKARSKREPFPNAQEVDVRKGEIIATTPASPKQQQPTPSSPQTRRRSATHQEPLEVLPDSKRSLSLTSLDDLKTPKVAHEKIPFMIRLGRSWSRRLSSAS